MINREALLSQKTSGIHELNIILTLTLTLTLTNLVTVINMVETETG